MYVKTAAIHDLIYNVLLFTPGKAEAKRVASRGLVAAHIQDKTITFTTTDGYTAMRSGRLDAADSFDSFYVDSENLKETEKNLRVCDEEEIQVVITGQLLWIGKTALKIEQPSDSQADLFEATNKMIDSDGRIKTPASNFQFAFNPSRVAKLSLLKPKDKYPLVGIYRYSFHGQPLWLWKYGPDAQGLIAPLDIEHLLEAFENPEEVLWSVR